MKARVYLFRTVTTLLIVVVVAMLYVVSFGPACGLCEKGILNQKVAWFIYRPCISVCFDSSNRFQWTFLSYAKSFGDQRRIEHGFMTDSGVFGSTSRRPVMRLAPDSMSPLDYERVRQSHATAD